MLAGFDGLAELHLENGVRGGGAGGDGEDRFEYAGVRAGLGEGQLQRVAGGERVDGDDFAVHGRGVEVAARAFETHTGLGQERQRGGLRALGGEELERRVGEAGGVAQVGQVGLDAAVLAGRRTAVVGREQRARAVAGRRLHPAGEKAGVGAGLGEGQGLLVVFPASGESGVDPDLQGFRLAGIGVGVGVEGAHPDPAADEEGGGGQALGVHQLDRAPHDRRRIGGAVVDVGRGVEGSHRFARGDAQPAVAGRAGGGGGREQAAEDSGPRAGLG